MVESKVNQPEFPLELDRMEFVFVKKLGSGGQAEVAMYKDPKTNQIYAVKFARLKDTSQSVLGECLFYRDHVKGRYDRIPKYFGHNT